MLRKDQIEDCQSKFNLSYHVNYAKICQDLVGFENSDVLEVGGSLPPDFVFNYLGAKSWTAIEAPSYAESLEQASGLTHTGTIISRVQNPEELKFKNYQTDKYRFYLENIEDLPDEYSEQFDLIFSIATFEHIHKLPAALDKMFLALRPGGKLFSMFSPIWSAHDGHHLPEIKDSSGQKFNFGNSPIPPWGHLLMTRGEMTRYLYEKVDKETADKIVYFVYQSDHINRYFTEDYQFFIENSPFQTLKFDLTFKSSIPSDIEKELKFLYPRQSNFSNNGILLISEKSVGLSQQTSIKNQMQTSNSYQILSDRQFDNKSEWTLTTPVAFVIFNRPDTTARVFEAIRQAKPPKLLVIADGPRSDRPDDIENCQAARAIVEKIDWDCEIFRNYSEVNLGCRKRVISGLDWVFEQVEEAIILEDDCLPHPTFFRYCQELLEKYRNDTRIMMISGDNFQFGRNKTEHSYYFSRYGHIWGWATWRRSWSLFDESMQSWPELRDRKWLEQFLGSEQVATFWTRIFQSVYDGFNSWAYIWVFTLWSQGGLTILPNVNLVSNIGFGSGTHTTMNDSPLANMKVDEIKFPLLHPKEIYRNIKADNFTEENIFSRATQGSQKYFISYAQNFEDVLLNRVFKEKRDGFYIDIGALHPKFDSVTKAFYDRGWSGINIEPIKEYFELFLQERTRDINLNIAISDTQGKLDFFTVDKQPANSTLNKEIALKVSESCGSSISKHTVSIQRLDEICNQYVQQNIDFLKIDVEGFEEQVVFGGDWNTFRPTILIIEATEPNTNIRCQNQIQTFLQDKNYTFVFFDGINDYYIANEDIELSKYFSCPVNILDFYVDHKLLEKQNLINLLKSEIHNIQLKNSLVINLTSSNLDKPTFIVDGVFFQMYSTGIARVWRSLLEEWAKTDFAKHILVLDRGGNSAPKIDGIKYRSIPLYDYRNTEADKQMLQEICNQENADLFISTYYTTPLGTPSVFMAYDMIPEVTGANLEDPMWREKHHAIQHASGYISISGNTADDLSRSFTGIDRNSVTVAHCGVSSHFYPAHPLEKDNFKFKYGIHKPYFLLGNLKGYKNSILFFQAFQELINRHQFDIVCTGAGSQLPNEWREYTSGCTVHNLYLPDDELRLAYSAAIALVYPSKYEGFGMPILEAMACGCPVITTRNASIPEVAGQAALYIDDDENVGDMADALYEVQKPRVRRSLIDAGLAQAQQFSWKKMANIIQEKLLEVASQFDSIKTQSISYLIFPDWKAPEDELEQDIASVFQKFSPETDRSITLLIDINDTTEEEANLVLSSVAMNLLMEEDLDISENLNFSFVEHLSSSQWEVLLPQVLARIQLDQENVPDLEAIESLPVISAHQPNYLICPNWNQEDDRLTEDLTQTLKNLAEQEENTGACVLIDISDMDAETIGLYLSELLMNLLLEQGIDLNDRLHLSLIGNLSEQQWESLKHITTIVS